MCKGESKLTDWKKLSIRFEENLNRTECKTIFKYHFDTNYMKWCRLNQHQSLNWPIAKIQTVHTSSCGIKNQFIWCWRLKSELLLSKELCVILTANIWIEVGIVNGTLGTIQNILFEKQELNQKLWN